ncbi:MAG: yocK [Planctomycetota bacterium]|nr:yocK [Planctomycetota bacterium]
MVTRRSEGETMTKVEMEYFRRRLLALKQRLGTDFSELESEAHRPVGGVSSGSLSDVPNHPANAAIDEYAEEVELELLQNEGQILSEVNDALSRIDQGTLGYCDSCHLEISLNRLEAIPYARYCIRCARRIERESGVRARG